MAFLCRVLQKTLSKLEHVWKVLRNVSLFRELYEWFGKCVKWISNCVLAIEKNALRAKKVTARSLGKAMSTMVVQEHHLWLNLAEMKDVDKARFLDAPATPSRALPSSSRQYSSRPRQSSTSCSGMMYHPPLPPGPGLSLPVAVGALLRPPELNQHLGRCFKPLAGERRLPASQPGGEENQLFCSAAGPRASGTHFSRKRNFLFLRVLRSMGWQCAMPCFLTLAHNPLLPAAKRVRFEDDVPPHAPLASPVWDPGSSLRMPQNAPPSVPSTPTPFRCTTTGTSIVPLEPLAQCLEAWLTLPSLSRAQFDSAMRFS